MDTHLQKASDRTAPPLLFFCPDLPHISRMMPDLTAKAPVAMHLWITGHGSLCSSAISFSQAAVNKLLGALFRTYKEQGGLARGSKKPPQASEQHQPAGGDTDAETCLAAPSSVNLDVLIRALRKKKPENFLMWSPNPRLGLNPPKRLCYSRPPSRSFCKLDSSSWIHFGFNGCDGK